MKCSRCGAANQADAHFCNNCGAPLVPASVGGDPAAAPAGAAQNSGIGVLSPAAPGGMAVIAAPGVVSAAAELPEQVLFNARPSVKVVFPTLIVWLIIYVAILAGMSYVLQQQKGYAIPDPKRGGLDLVVIIVAVLVALVPLFFLFRQFIQVLSVKFRLTTQRLLIEYGIFGRRTEEFELERYRDVYVRQSFLDKIVGCGDIEVLTTDESDPSIFIRNIADPIGRKEAIRAAARERKIVLGIVRREEL